jgi:nucleoside-diphosphate-sugar epimerase
VSRVVVIGSTGHIGTFLVPRLVAGGHEVVAISRGQAQPYRADPAWDDVEQVVMDRAALEATGAFGEAVAELRPDVVVDNICFAEDSSRQLADALTGTVALLVHVGTIWTHGHGVAVPVHEDDPREPFGEYGVAKLAIERDLLARSRDGALPVTVVHPGHIVGPGWWPLNPAGNFDPEVFAALARGERLSLPNLGLETVHHVYADDVAGVIEAALAHPEQAIGQSFHATSERALSLRGYAEAIAGWFGVEPDLAFAPYEEWARDRAEEHARATWEHIARSPSCSMAKARDLLGFRPAWTSLAAVQESVTWQIERGALPGVPARS